MRLIDETEYQESLAKIPMEERTFRRAVEVAEDMPTIDAVPVVRCRECKHTREKTAYEAVYLKPECLICEHPEVSEDGWAVVTPEHFCSYRERKEDN